MAKLDFKALNEKLQYTMWSVFKVRQGELDLEDGDRAAVAAEFSAFLASFDDEELTVRGVYDLTGQRAEADIMIWWHAEKFDDLQRASGASSETALGRASEPVWTNSFAPPCEFSNPPVIVHHGVGRSGCGLPLRPSSSGTCCRTPASPPRRTRMAARGSTKSGEHRQPSPSATPSGSRQSRPGPDRGPDYQMRCRARRHVREEITLHQTPGNSARSSPDSQRASLSYFSLVSAIPLMR